MLLVVHDLENQEKEDRDVSNGLTEQEIAALRRLLEQEGPEQPAAEEPTLSANEIEALRGQAESLAAAAEAAGRAAANNPETAEGLFEAGRLWELTAMWGRAIEFYERALDVDPDYHEATARLALTRIKARQRQEALRLASELVTRDPQFRFKTIKENLTISAFTVLADALRVNGAVDDAIRAYQEALRLETGDRHSAARLAELYLLEGRTDEASELEPQIDDTFNPGLKATLRLARNDRELLPTIAAVRASNPLDEGAA